MSTKDKFENSGKGTSRRNILQAASWAVGACGVLPIARASGQQVVDSRSHSLPRLSPVVP